MEAIMAPLTCDFLCCTRSAVLSRCRLPGSTRQGCRLSRPVSARVRDMAPQQHRRQGR